MVSAHRLASIRVLAKRATLPSMHGCSIEPPAKVTGRSHHWDRASPSCSCVRAVVSNSHTRHKPARLPGLRVS